MGLRKVRFTSGEYYHICNRSNDKGEIFCDERDYSRFLFSILYSQSSQTFTNLHRYVTRYIKMGVFTDETEIKQINKNRLVSLINFSVMPNHFHLVLREDIDGGITRYLQRIENAYAKYFNTKYSHQGHVFQGAFRAVHIKTNDQMLYTSAYIHRNSRDLSNWQGKEETYPWSSYQDYCLQNRWEQLLYRDILLSQFSNPLEYKTFMDTSAAKLNSEYEVLDTWSLTI